MNKFILSLMGIAALGIASCASTAHVGGIPPAALTFENYQPMTLNVASSTVTEDYAVQNDPKDISGQFILAPSEAVKRYGARRFPASGTGNGQFNISIEDARVYLEELKQPSKALSWANIGTEDRYRLLMRLRVTSLPDHVDAKSSTVLKFERTLVMPASSSLAEREKKQLEFLETLIADIDAAIQRTLDQTPAMRQ